MNVAEELAIAATRWWCQRKAIACVTLFIIDRSCNCVRAAGESAALFHSRLRHFEKATEN